MSEREVTNEARDSADESPSQEKQTISFNLLKTSTIKKIYIHDLNDHQLKLYELFTSMPLSDELKDALYAAILSTPITTVQEFIRAKDVLLRIILDINSGKLTVRSTLRAVFKGAYDKAASRQLPKKPPINKQTAPRPVPFYDWLAIRE